MALQLAKIAQMLGGKLVGDGRLAVTGAAILRDAEPGQVSFVDDVRLVDELTGCRASAFIVSSDIDIENRPFIVVEHPRAAFTNVVAHFRPRPRASHVGVSSNATVASNAKLGRRVSIHAHACVGDDVILGDGCSVHSGVHILPGCRIGSDVEIFPGAVLYEGTIVGDRTIIHATAVIGSYGFGYESDSGHHELCPQLGYVDIGSDVEIGAGTTIDRGTFGATRIGNGTKIDNQVMIGHNCRIGKHNLLCSQVGIAGSVTTGDYVVMAGQVGIRDHITICDQVILGARSGVGSDITEPGTYFGAPARPDKEQLQILLAQQKVPAMRRQLKDLQREVAALRSEDRSGRAEAA